MSKISALFRGGGGVRAQILRAGSGSAGLKVGQAALSLAVSIVLARSLGPEGFGTYSYVFALVTLLAIPAQLGLPLLVVRETAAACAKGDWKYARGIWRWTTLFVLVFSIVLVLLAVASLLFFRHKLSESQVWTVVFGLGFVPLAALGSLRGAALRGLQKVVLSQIPEQILRPILLLGSLVVLEILAGNVLLDPAVAMAAHACAAGFSFVAAALLLEYAIRDIRERSRLYRSKEWMRSAIPVAAIAGLQVLNNQADVLMIGLYMDVEDVGVYRVAAQGGLVALFIFQSLNVVVMPLIAKLYAEDDMGKLRRLMRSSAQILFLASAAILALIFLFGEFAINIAFGRLYSDAIVPLLILCSGFVFSSWFGFGGALLIMTGYEAEATRAAFVATVCNLAGNFLLIPILGITGAAIATAASYVIWRMILNHYSIKRVGVQSRCSFDRKLASWKRHDS